VRELVDTTLCLGALRVSCRGPASDVAWLEEQVAAGKATKEVIKPEKEGAVEDDRP